MLRQGNRIEIVKGFPRGAELTFTTLDTHTGDIVLFVEHPEFDPVPAYAHVPNMDVIVQDLDR